MSLNKDTIDIDIKEEYHKWYYDTHVWQQTTYFGVPILKSVSDMWNYQEIVNEIYPSLIIEFGVNRGGSTLFFSHILERQNKNGMIISMDVTDVRDEKVKQCKNVEFLQMMSTSESAIARIKTIVETKGEKIFAILDSDHSKENVFNELKILRNILKKGDYLIVEDTNINGHPVLKEFGEGPMEALQEYMELYPDDYNRDSERENKFGFTFAPEGFLIRK